MYSGQSTMPVFTPDPFTPVAEPRSPGQLLADSSLELTSNGRETINEGSALLRPGTKVYVPKAPRENWQHKMLQIRFLKEAGVQPVPHIVARQLASENELTWFAREAAIDFGVTRVLVIGGDQKEPAGPFKDAAAVIGSGILSDAGIRQIDIAGYPDGHPVIPTPVLIDDLHNKMRLAAEQSLELNIVTQFSFSADSIAEYCANLAAQDIDLPVFAGFAGPTNPAQLLRYAKICGVSTSIKAANKLGWNAVKLAANTTPDRHLDILTNHYVAGDSGNLAGIHIFSFGGFIKSAAWLAEKTSS